MSTRIEIGEFFREIKAGVKDMATLIKEIEHFEEFAALKAKAQEVKQDLTAIGEVTDAWYRNQQALAE